MFFKKQELPTFLEHLGSPLIFGVAPVHLFNFLYCVLFVFVLCLVCQLLRVSLDCPFISAPLTGFFCLLKEKLKPSNKYVLIMHTYSIMHIYACHIVQRRNYNHFHLLLITSNEHQVVMYL